MSFSVGSVTVLFSTLIDLLSLKVLAMFGLDTSSSAAAVTGVLYALTGLYWVLANPHLKQFTKVNFIAFKKNMFHISYLEPQFFFLRNKSKKYSVFLDLKRMTKLQRLMGAFGLARLYVLLSINVVLIYVNNVNVL